MGALACMLAEKGYAVTGSDQGIYPPMSTFLARKGIDVTQGFRSENIPPDTDLVIIGNAVRRNNPEAVATRVGGYCYCSLPQALNHFAAKGKETLLFTGTHGKTTTSAMMAWILHYANLDPSFMIGGILKNFDANYRLGNGRHMVIEGDEYDTAFFDKGAKFLHFQPHLAVLTSVEFDHADIFRLTDVSVNQSATNFQVLHNNQPHGRFTTRMLGEHNLLNALSVIAMAAHLNIPTDTVSEALLSFKGIKRRQEKRGIVRGITVMDDFAHHPTAVRETIRAVKPICTDGRLIAVFEPRTNTSMRDVFQTVYPGAFDDADLICIRKPPLLEKVPKGQRFSSEQLVEDLNQRGKTAHFFPDTDTLLDFLTAEAVSGDVVLIMSNGEFDNIHDRLLKRL